MAKEKKKQERKKDNVVTGVDYLISEYKPPLLMDCHMHIQSNNCAPLPFLWEQIQDTTIVARECFHLSRGVIKSLGNIAGFASEFVLPVVIPGKLPVMAVEKVFGWLFKKNADEYSVTEEDRRHKLRKTLDISSENTYNIGTSFLQQRRKAVYDHLKSNAKIYSKVEHLSFPCVVMTMDMEYAHIDGYFGLKIYNPIMESAHVKTYLGGRVKSYDPGIDEKTQKKEVRYYWIPLHGRFIKDNRAEGEIYLKDNKNPLNFEANESMTLSEFQKKEDDMDNFGIPGIYYNQNQQPQKISIKAAPCLTSQKETERYEQWKHQLFRTELAVLQQPLKLLPMFHYDPRRWQVYGQNGNVEPFKYVDYGKDEAIYLGFKMYTAQGYRPWDVRRLPIMMNFYAECVTRRIPITNHCTPEGAPTLDRKQYMKFQHPMDNHGDILAKQDKSREIIGLKPGVYSNTEEYFFKEFVSPNAWRKVLSAKVGETRLNKLRICLAHFGGGTDTGLQWCNQLVQLMKEFPHVYADISSSMSNDKFKDHFKSIVCRDPDFKKTIRHRILFGTDWYLTLLSDKDYLTYVMETKKFLDDIHWSLWTRFTMLNPHEFFLLNERIDKIAKSMINMRKKIVEEGTADEELGKVLIELKEKDISAIKQEATAIKASYTPLKNIEESQKKKKSGGKK